MAPPRSRACDGSRSPGYRVVAVVDNEPDLIRAMAAAETGEVLFLHADTIFASRRDPMPRTVSGSSYGLTGLVDEAEIGRRVTLAWHGVNDRAQPPPVPGSDGPLGRGRRPSAIPIGRLVLRHDSFVDTPWTRDEAVLPLQDCLDVLRSSGRSVKLDLKEA